MRGVLIDQHEAILVFHEDVQATEHTEDVELPGRGGGFTGSTRGDGQRKLGQRRLETWRRDGHREQTLRRLDARWR